MSMIFPFEPIVLGELHTVGFLIVQTVFANSVIQVYRHMITDDKSCQIDIGIQGSERNIN